MAEFNKIDTWAVPGMSVGTGSVIHAQEAMSSVIIGGRLSTSAVWPVANTAIYVPVSIPSIVTAYQISIQVATQSGNCDVGIYDEIGNRLVSSGSTLVGAAGIQLFNITDTVLVPGVYYLAMNCDNTTASFFRNGRAPQQTVPYGLKQQAVGAVTLPNPATFAVTAQSYLPVLYAHLVATV